MAALVDKHLSLPMKGRRSELTVREREIIGLVRIGLSDKQIAFRLGLSPYTVNNHIRHLMAKLGVHSRIEAVYYEF